jgi:hypothetical protein
LRALRPTETETKTPAGAYYLIRGDGWMFSMEEKEYMLKLLAKEKRRGWFGLLKTPAVHGKLKEKLEQMIRNEQVNRKHL